MYGKHIICLLESITIYSVLELGITIERMCAMRLKEKIPLLYGEVSREKRKHVLFSVFHPSDLSCFWLNGIKHSG